jgi:type I restriction enzyme M protein
MTPDSKCPVSTPPRPLEEIEAELKQAEEEILRLLREVTK